jgi:hypothetical protein
MFHLPAFPLVEIEQYLGGFVIVGATGISIYQFLEHKIHTGRRPRKRKRHGARPPNRDERRDSHRGEQSGPHA